MWQTRPHRKPPETFCVSFTFLASTFVGAFALGLGKILLRFLVSKRYSCPSSLSMTSSLPASLSPTSLFKISHSHRSRATSTGVDNCHSMQRALLRSPGTGVAVLSTPLPGASKVSYPWATCLRCALDGIVQGFPMLEERETGPQLSNFCRRKDLPAVAKTASGLQWVVHGGQSSPLLQARLPCSFAECFEGSTLCPRDQEMLQLLAQFHCHPKVCDVLCSDRLSLFFISLHRLFQCWMSHNCKVCGQVRPRSPARTALLPEPIQHLILRLHQPDTCTRVCLMITPSEGDSPHGSHGSKLWCVQALRVLKTRPSSLPFGPLTRPRWPFERPLAQIAIASGETHVHQPSEGKEKDLNAHASCFAARVAYQGPFFLCVGELPSALLRLNVTLSVLRLQVQLHQPPAQEKTLLFERY